MTEFLRWMCVTCADGRMYTTAPEITVYICACGNRMENLDGPAPLWVVRHDG